MPIHDPLDSGRTRHDTPEPHFISSADGSQFRVWTLGCGPLLVLLPGLFRSPQQRAMELAAIAKDWTIVSVELPGLGASTLPQEFTLAAVARPLAKWLDAMDGPVEVACFDGFGPVGAELLRQSSRALRLTCINQKHWASARSRGMQAPASELARDGSHLSRLWHHLRDLDLLDFQAENRARRQGAEFLTAEQLDEALICFAAQPGAYSAHWQLAMESLRPADHDPWRMRTLDADEGCMFERADGQRATVLPAITAVLPVEGGSTSAIRRAHARIPRGRLHLRAAGQGHRLLIALLGGASSSAILEPVLTGMSGDFLVVAPDYIGQGDSCRAPSKTTIAELAQDVLDLATSLGFERFDLYGTHTGAYVALEAGIAGADRIRRIILDGMALSPPHSRLETSEHYFPDITPDVWGLHVLKAWNIRRDQGYFFPWFMASPSRARSASGFGLASVHDRTIATLRSQTTPAYRAAICDYDASARIGSLAATTWLAAGPRDTFAADLALAKDCDLACLTVKETPATVWFPGEDPQSIADTLAQFKAFLAHESTA